MPVHRTMEVQTLIVGLIGVLVVALSRPTVGLITYLGVLLVFPTYLRASLGTIEINAQRMIVSALLIRCIFSPVLLKHFQWKLLDTIVTASMVVYAITLSCTTPFDVWIENRARHAMDTWVVYLVVRLVLIDRAAVFAVSKALGVIAVPLAITAIAEMLWAWSPYSLLLDMGGYSARRGPSVYKMRSGLFRSEGPSGECIMYGLTYGTILPLIWMLRHLNVPWKSLSYPLAGAAIVGVATTLSGGSYVCLVVILCCLALERAKHLAKPVCVAMLLCFTAIELVSNRHFYDPILDLLAFDASNAWYRSQLFEVAIRKLPEYWTVGYGLVDPGWGPLIDGRDKTDGVNDYIVHGILYGMPGLIAHVLVLVVALRAVIQAHATAASAWTRSFSWAVGSAMVGLIFAQWSVSLFTYMESLFYVLIGMHGAANAIARPRPIRRAHSFARRAER